MRCDHCGYDNPPGVTSCGSCGASLPPRPEAPRLSQKAVWSVVLAILGLCLPVVLSIPALILGILALSDINKSGGRITGHSVAIAGIVLSIVCGLISLIMLILAAIAVPNFLHAQQRAKVVRVQSEQLSVAIALESFYVDDNRYPTDREYYTGDLLPGGDILEAKFERTLTSPVAYISVLPGDVFRERAYHYGYWTNGRNVWIVRSVGPDKTPDADLARLGEYLSSRRRNEPWPPELAGWFYDPTNGAKSRGDIIKTGR
ncbi:DUF4190 domain-containing protein [bacterium]|nr:DUF4190 domain-containing protein [bacterium]